MELIVEEKLGIIKNEYSIQVDDEFIKYVNTIYDFSQEIREKGRAYGRTRVKKNYLEYA